LFLSNINVNNHRYYLCMIICHSIYIQIHFLIKDMINFFYLLFYNMNYKVMVIMEHFTFIDPFILLVIFLIKVILLFILIIFLIEVITIMVITLFRCIILIKVIINTNLVVIKFIKVILVILVNSILICFLKIFHLILVQISIHNVDIRLILIISLLIIYFCFRFAWNVNHLKIIHLFNK